jgi:2'-5' RNA ligase
VTESSAMTPERIAEIKAGYAAWQKALKSYDTDEWHFTATALAEQTPDLMAECIKQRERADELERQREELLGVCSQVAWISSCHVRETLGQPREEHK